ncbi:YdeI/OmpD-associated family protein [Chryseobacterium turcicum]|uniref:YdeI/OmpD-associated family protein n=1 Tax=Chryseobacterium turcicum TaxID=2898076 RepID=A0A9Q3V5J2_9FLAO|nr:YdeI/OmpD-associated family protein [Chryseobacterium turcicum]MCD1118163.1 YdeI/OmpD-associated family protein [Chryseobacterium turcicum]
MSATFFPTPQDFRNWLDKNHKTEQELLVGFYKVGTQKPSMTWSESVNQALCFGWIDGVRKSIDEESYSIRFTPRKKDSIWSVINIKKIEELTKLGLMKNEGLEAFKLRKEDKSGIYSHEKEPAQLKPEYEKQFKTNKKAWEFFEKQAPSYKKVMIHWIMSAKQEKTQLSRLEKTIIESEKEKRVL